MGLTVDVRPLENMTDDEIRQYMFNKYNVIISAKELINVKNMFSIRKSIKQITYGGII